MYEDTVTLLQPTVLALRVCGVCPSSLRRLYIPISNKIYGVCLVLFSVISDIFILYKIRHVFSGIAAFIHYIGSIGLVARQVVLILSVTLTSESLVKFVRIMESAQRSLSSLNIKQPSNPTRKSQVVWLSVLFAPKILAVLCGLSTFGFANCTPTIAKSLHSMVITGTACKIRVLMTLVRGKFELLNWHLDDLNNRWPVFLPRPPDVSFREFSCVREWRRTKFLQENEDTRTVTAEKIKNFNKAHLKLFYAYKTLTSIFSCAILFFIVPSVLYIALGIPLTINLNPSSMLFFNFLLDYIGEIMAIVVILAEASKLQEQNEKTALLVHDLLDEDHHSPDVVRELEEFSMSLLHRRTTFTAGGFFDVNLKLVARVAGLLAPIILFMTQTVSKTKFYDI